MTISLIAENLYILNGAVNTGVLISGQNALLFDCCDTVTFERLAELGLDSIQAIDLILCTQYRRPNTAGAYPFLAQGVQLVAPAAESHHFTDVDAYWGDPQNRWHIYHHQPGPQAPVKPLPVSRAVREGEVIEWGGFTIHVLETPGATEGSVSYWLDIAGQRICFSGDVIYGPGQLWDFYSLQKGEGDVRDYHSFLGNKRLLIPSLQKLAECGADMLIPSHGDPIHQPQKATTLVIERLAAVWRNYTAISALNHYFPNLFADTQDEPDRMKAAATHEPPPFIRRVAATSFAIISTSGEALITDCGAESVVETLQTWLAKGAIKSVAGCWITHYHDDHVDALPQLRQAFNCPLMTHEHLVELVTHPERFFLPCISPVRVSIDRTLRHGETWQWHEFKLTAFHLPAQTYYHNGLLVEGYGKKVLIAGDAAAPTGLDDYCAGNRNFLGAEKGYRACIDLWRQLKPDYIFNAHQDLAFSFTEAELSTLETTLISREHLFTEMLPWPHANFGADEHWVRTYPYQQTVSPGQLIYIDVQFTNHGPEASRATVEPVLPPGWQWDERESAAMIYAPAQTDGATGPYCLNPDKSARVAIFVPETTPAGQYVIPFRITWGERYLGQFRHAVVLTTDD